MEFFQLALISFPLIIGVLLKSKYLREVVVLGVINFGLLAFEYFQYNRPLHICETSGKNLCDNSSTVPFLLFFGIVIISVVLWYLAFKQKANVTGIASKSATYKSLTVVGWLIIAFVVFTVVGFIIAFSQI